MKNKRNKLQRWSERTIKISDKSIISVEGKSFFYFLKKEKATATENPKWTKKTPTNKRKNPPNQPTNKPTNQKKPKKPSLIFLQRGERKVWAMVWNWKKYM